MSILEEFDQSKYFLGNLCNKNHDYKKSGKSLRYTKRGRCVECQRDSANNYYTKNADSVKAKQKQLYPKNKEKIAKRDKLYREKNLEKISQRKKDYYQNNKARIRVKNRFYHEQNKEKRLRYGTEWRQKNREYKNQKQAEYRKENPEKVRQSLLSWYEKNRDRQKLYMQERQKSLTEEQRQSERERSRVKSRKRRALIKSAHIPYTEQQVKEKFAAMGNACFYCSSLDQITVDHYIPINKGGWDSLDNLVPACSRCNFSKRDMLPDEWIQRLLERLQ
ncbi:HNH endonuclease (plasmid) [Kovacikia minuta CCNUW1]|uniref:HNH endonuclease n=1 Tax=Kovacikia minuta TaxID=2931930 RepID=UPI001CC924DF|nr:HNH endonuclease signature motif containing protein [Kovacikia minuta]UBF29837.1 HNH endonuclease [Kovacikia minuta CCNUW1]